MLSGPDSMGSEGLEGGEFYFVPKKFRRLTEDRDQAHPELVVQNVPGRMLSYESTSDNVHATTPITKGVKAWIHFYFTEGSVEGAELPSTTHISLNTGLSLPRISLNPYIDPSWFDNPNSANVEEYREISRFLLQGGRSVTIDSTDVKYVREVTDAAQQSMFQFNAPPMAYIEVRTYPRGRVGPVAAFRNFIAEIVNHTRALKQRIIILKNDPELRCDGSREALKESMQNSKGHGVCPFSTRLARPCTLLSQYIAVLREFQNADKIHGIGAEGFCPEDLDLFGDLAVFQVDFAQPYAICGTGEQVFHCFTKLAEHCGLSRLGELTKTGNTEEDQYFMNGRVQEDRPFSCMMQIANVDANADYNSKKMQLSINQTISAQYLMFLTEHPAIGITIGSYGAKAIQAENIPSPFIYTETTRMNFANHMEGGGGRVEKITRETFKEEEARVAAMMKKEKMVPNIPSINVLQKNGEVPDFNTLPNLGVPSFG